MDVNLRPALLFFAFWLMSAQPALAELLSSKTEILCQGSTPLENLLIRRSADGEVEFMRVEKGPAGRVLESQRLTGEYVELIENDIVNVVSEENGQTILQMRILPEERKAKQQHAITQWRGRELRCKTSAAFRYDAQDLELAIMAAQNTVHQDPRYLAGLNAWRQFKTQQDQVCAPMYDATEKLLPQRARTSVLFLHGLAVNPFMMRTWVQYFADRDMNVIAPRFAGHSTMDSSLMDKATYKDWLKQARESLRIARSLGDQVLVVGFSLGGLLATRLALESPELVDGLVLISPALALTRGASMMARMGSWFNLGLSDGAVSMSRPDCGQVRVSGKAGTEILKLQQQTMKTYQLSSLPDRTIVVLSAADEVVDTISIESTFRNLQKTRLQGLKVLRADAYDHDAFREAEGFEPRPDMASEMTASEVDQQTQLSAWLQAWQ